MSEPIEKKIQELHRCHDAMLAELGKVVVGQRETPHSLQVISCPHAC
jgi:hypothetical protein